MSSESRRASTMILTLVFMFVMPLCPLLGDGHLHYVLLHVIGPAFGGLGWVLARPSMHEMRLTLRGARRSLLRALPVSLVLAALGLGMRLLCDRAGLLPPGTPLFRWTISLTTALYLLIAVPLQEIGWRGLYQGMVRELVGSGRAASVAAVVAPSFAFASMHFGFGWKAAALTLIPGLAWGWLAEIDETLVGVVVSHGVTGWFFFTSLSMTEVLYRHT
jgi:hypothetical protein